MNYFKLISAFYDSQLLNPLSTGQIALWNALAFINNRCAWIEWFTVANQTIELMTGLNKSTIVRNRNILKQQGLIDFKLGNGNKACKYKLIDISNSSHATQNATQNATVMQQICDTVCNDYATDMRPLNNITKTNNNYIINARARENLNHENLIQEIQDSISNYTNNQELKTALFNYAQMRKEKGNELTKTSLSEVFKRLLEFKDDKSRIESLKYSTIAGYPQLYEVKENKPSQNVRANRAQKQRLSYNETDISEQELERVLFQNN